MNGSSFECDQARSREEAQKIIMRWAEDYHISRRQVKRMLAYGPRRIDELNAFVAKRFSSPVPSLPLRQAA